MMRIKRRSGNLPGFSRNSIAFDDRGLPYPPHRARIVPTAFGNGILIEEATSNVLSADQSSFETSISEFAINPAHTTTRDTENAWHGSASLKIEGVTGGIEWLGYLERPVFGDAPYTASMYVKGNADEQLRFEWYDAFLNFIRSDVVTFVADPNWLRVTLTAISPSNAAYVRIVPFSNTAQVFTSWHDGFGLEQKPYATSWQLGGTSRTSEVFFATLPQPLTQEFAALGRFIPMWGYDVNRGVNTNIRIAEFAQATPVTPEQIILAYNPGDAAFRFFKITGGNQTILQSSSVGGGLPAFSSGDEIRWVIQQTQTGMTLSLLINGEAHHFSNTNTTSFAQDLVRLYIGTASTGGIESNGIHNEVVVLSKTLTDQEIEDYWDSGQPWNPDEHTLVYLPFNRTSRRIVL